MKAVIFDIDGTLYSYDKAHEKGFSAVCRYAQNVLGIPEADFAADCKRLFKQINSELGAQAAMHTRAIRFQRILEERGLSLSYVDVLEEMYWNTLIQESAPEPGLEQCLADLKAAGYVLGIGTNMTLVWQIKKLKALGLIDYFQFIVSSEETGVEKPDKKLFDMCAQKAGAEPGQCVFVGDSLKNDVLGAEKAGMKAVWYAPGKDDFMGHAGISHYDQLKKQILVL